MGTSTPLSSTSKHPLKGLYQSVPLVTARCTSTPVQPASEHCLKGQPRVFPLAAELALKRAVVALADFDCQVLSSRKSGQPSIPVARPMHPEEIKAAMRMAGTTPAMLCDEMGVAASSMSQAISGHIKSQRIQKRIGEIIGKPVEAIWPNQVVLRRSRAQIEAQRAARSA